jgi:hypothetical protein
MRSCRASSCRRSKTLSTSLIRCWWRCFSMESSSRGLRRPGLAAAAAAAIGARPPALQIELAVEECPLEKGAGETEGEGDWSSLGAAAAEAGPRCGLSGVAGRSSSSSDCQSCWPRRLKGLEAAAAEVETVEGVEAEAVPKAGRCSARGRTPLRPLACQPSGSAAWASSVLATMGRCTSRSAAAGSRHVLGLGASCGCARCRAAATAESCILASYSQS